MYYLACLDGHKICNNFGLDFEAWRRLRSCPHGHAFAREECGFFVLYRLDRQSWTSSWWLPSSTLVSRLSGTAIAKRADASTRTWDLAAGREVSTPPNHPGYASVPTNVIYTHIFLHGVVDILSLDRCFLEDLLKSHLSAKAGWFGIGWFVDFGPSCWVRCLNRLDKVE
jgi:hypothetical protein